MNRDFRISVHDAHGWMKGIWVVFVMPAAVGILFILFLIGAWLVQVIR